MATPAAPWALDHLRVLDLTSYLAQTCARFLGDLGADVVKIEPPGGDPARWLPPFAGEAPHAERSLRFINANRSKRSVVLDLGSAEDRERVRTLAERADILVEDFAPGYLAGLGLGYEELRERNPGLIYVSITPFGQTGPHAGYRGGELVAEATGGVMFANGDDSRAPCMAPYELVSQMACVHAAYGALVAVSARRRTGRGQHVDVSRQEICLWSENSYISRYSYQDQITRREGHHSAFGGVNTYRCADGGYVNLSIYNANHFERLAKGVMDHPVLSDPMWQDRAVRQENREVVDSLIQEYAETVGRDDFVERGQGIGIPIVPVLTIEEFVNHPHPAARGYFIEMEHPVIGRYRTAGPPVRMSVTPWRPARPAPLLGQHTQEVLRELEGHRAPAQALRQAQGERAGRDGAGAGLEGSVQALEGVRVTDFTRAFAGPLATMFLGFFGAQVIKVESADLDEGRALGQSTFPDLNRNKLGCTIDARTPEGKDLIKELVRRSDFVVENFRPGVMDRLGIGYEALRRERRDIIMVGMPGMGNSGPLRDYFCYGQQIMGVAGLTYLWGHPDAPLDTRIKMPFADYVAGAFGALSGAAALEYRERTGQGQYVELAQLEGTAHLLGVASLEYLVNGRAPRPRGNFSETHAPHDVYPCTGQDAWCAIEVGTDEEWAALLRAMGNPAWGREERWRSLAGRVAHKEELDRRLGEWTRQFAPKQLMRLLQKVGVPAGVVANGEDLFYDLHLRSRLGCIVSVTHPGGFGTIEHQGITVRLSETPGRADLPAPTIKGTDNAFVYREVLGLDAERERELAAAGALR